MDINFKKKGLKGKRVKWLNRRVRRRTQYRNPVARELLIDGPRPKRIENKREQARDKAAEKEIKEDV